MANTTSAVSESMLRHLRECPSCTKLFLQTFIHDLALIAAFSTRSPVFGNDEDEPRNMTDVEATRFRAAIHEDLDRDLSELLLKSQDEIIAQARENEAGENDLGHFTRRSNVAQVDGLDIPADAPPELAAILRMLAAKGTEVKVVRVPRGTLGGDNAEKA